MADVFGNLSRGELTDRLEKHEARIAELERLLAGLNGSPIVVNTGAIDVSSIMVAMPEPCVAPDEPLVLVR